MIYYVLVLIAVVVGTAFLIAQSKQSEAERRNRLSKRGPVEESVWREVSPETPFEIVLSAHAAIALGLSVAPENLKPTDQFQELRLDGPFDIDGDPTDEIAEFVKEELGVEWKKQWKTVGDAVCGICKLSLNKKHAP